MEDYEILDVEDIIELHDMLIRDFGGMSGIFPDTENINSYILSIGKILKDNSIYLYDNYEE